MENLADEVRIGNYNDATYAQGSIGEIKIHNLELSAAEVKELYSGASVPFKYKGANQTALSSSTFINYGGTYSTFDGASATGFHAISTSGTDFAGTVDEVVFVAGKQYAITFTATLTSGQVPYIDGYDNHNGNVIVNFDGVVSGGANRLEGTCTQSTTGVISFFSTAAAEYTIADFKVTQIGAVAEYDGSSAGVAKWYDNSGNGLDGSVSGATLENANAVGVQRIDDSTGAVTMPEQPAFLAYPASNQQDFAADDSFVTVVFGTEVFDQGANFASNTFTAPVTGKYQLNANIYLINVDSASGYYDIRILTSNKAYYSIIDPDFGQDSAYWSISLSVLADMDASDTVTIGVRQSSGTAQTDASVDSNFSGYLVC